GIDLQISGHTHNGQLFPGNLIAKAIYELSHGYMKKGKTNYIVSSGLGLWGPMLRIGTQSEIVVVKLKIEN
ncbi:MAG: metallophosphoesterase, partial [Dysgonamonadaceae bacterium]|nr:metallophosphoesterase [Dysgonamonadaceae bacterium]